MTKTTRLFAILALGLAGMAQAQVYGSKTANLTSPSLMSFNGIALSTRLPDARQYTGYTVYTSDQGLMYSNGTAWATVASGLSPITGRSFLCNPTATLAVPTPCLTLALQAPMVLTTTGAPQLLSTISVSGTVTSGQAAYHQFNINSDSLNTTGPGGPGGAYGLYVGQIINNPSMTGHRTSIDGLQFITGPSGNGNGSSYFYTGTAGQCNASANDNGTAGAGNSVGNCFGMFGSARLQNGATFWNSVVGLELDIGINSGASAAYETGLQIVHWTTAAVKGSSESTALSFSDQNAATSAWDRLIGIGSSHGIFPVNGGTIMGLVATSQGGSAYSVAHGIDFVTGGPLVCVTDCFRSTGFTVDGSGTTDVKNLTVNGKLVVSSTAPTITSGFGSGATVSQNNGTASFSINVGTGGVATNGVIGMPTASHAWACGVADVTTPAGNMTQETATGASSVTITNYVRTTGIAGAWPASDVIQLECTPN